MLVQKLQAVPALLEEIDAKRDTLLDAYAEGMKRERYLEKKEVLAAEERKIHKQETEYREQLNHYETLIAEVEKSLSFDFSLDSEEKVEALVDKTEEIWGRVSGITDDKERSAIIHKHFKKVTVEKTKFTYKFQIHPEGKAVNAKRIVIYPYVGGERTFVFIPNDGKGGTMLELHKSAGDKYTIPGTGQEVVVPEYSVFHMEYLPRLYDTGKKRRRADMKAAREKETQAAVTAMRQQGFLSMDDLIVKTGLSYSTLYNAIKDGKMPGVSVCKKWYVKTEDFESYISQYPPKPREKKNKEQQQAIARRRLLDAILNADSSDD